MAKGLRTVCLPVMAATVAACQTADAGSMSADGGVCAAAYDCAASQYDRIFQTAGQDDRLYNVEDRNRVTGLLRDSAVAGEGAGEDAERRIRNMLGDDYGRLFLDAFAGCMRDIS